MPDPTATAHQTLLDAGTALAETLELTAGSQATPDLLTAVVPAGYQISSLDVAAIIRKHEGAPRRVRGTATVTDTASWLAYYSKHGTTASEVFGDVQASTVTAILNAPEAQDPAWGDHRAVLQLQHSAAWTAWTSHDGQWLAQSTFAEHLEDRTPDLVEPDAASMLELAQSFHATTGVKFESSSRLADGQRRFTYLETVEGKAGQRGELSIPTQIRIQVPVWRGVAIVVPMTARFRYRVQPEGLRLGYVLDRLEDVLDAAWSSLLGELTDTLPVPVLAGQAPRYDA
jgi:uncharacterized protein YfdQ (DUF2303 family)